MYYVLTNNIENDRTDAILDGRSAYLVRIECSFRNGISLPFEDIDTPILFELFEYTLRGKMTDHLNINVIPGPVISYKTQLLFESSNIRNTEYYHLTLIDEFPEGKKVSNKKNVLEYNNYFIANVVGLVDCVDHEKSILEYFYPPELRNQEKEELPEGSSKVNNPFEGENPNDIDFITKLVLDESKVDPAQKIFRLKDQPHLLIFHESIVEQIRKEKLSGFVFVPVEKYTDAIPDDEDESNETNIIEQEQKEIIKEEDVNKVIIKTNEERKKDPQKNRFTFLD